MRFGTQPPGGASQVPLERSEIRERPLSIRMVVAVMVVRRSIDLEGAVRGSLHPALFLTAFAPDVFGSSGRAGHYWGPPSAIWNDTGLYLAQNMGQLYMGAFVTGLIGVYLPAGTPSSHPIDRVVEEMQRAAQAAVASRKAASATSEAPAKAKKKETATA